MKTICLHDKQTIETFLRENTFHHLYPIGDLDDFFWPYTTWYALTNGHSIVQLALLYTAMELPILLGITEQSSAEMIELLRSLVHLLPKRFYVHLHSDVAPSLSENYHLQSHGTHYQMALQDISRLNKIDTSSVVALTSADSADLEKLYSLSYPGNWFDPRMLETGYYYGMRRDSTLLSVAGVHVYSQHYKVAALGNIATHPEMRGQGLAMKVCAGLCQALAQSVDHIGLNVKTDNHAAISCYTRVGFERIAVYEEFMCTLKQAQ